MDQSGQSAIVVWSVVTILCIRFSESLSSCEWLRALHGRVDSIRCCRHRERGCGCDETCCTECVRVGLASITVTKVVSEREWISVQVSQ